MQKIAIILLGIVVTISSVIAQEKTAVKGINGLVVDDDQKPLPFATVSLVTVNDSVVVKGTLTDDKGYFHFDHIKVGYYLIRVTSIGYKSGFSSSFQFTGRIAIPPIILHRSGVDLKTVNITTAKPIIQQLSDRMIINVENSILSAGNSAFDILQKTPGVSIDKDDQISLKGKPGVTIMINDKLTFLSSGELATLLQSMDGNSIHSIEIITNPSAKYDAAGNSGIINIKLKKSTKNGTHVNIVTGIGFSRYFKDNFSLALNHQKDNFTFYSTFSHLDNERFKTLDISRIVDSADNKIYFNQHTVLPRIFHNSSYRAGAEYAINKNNTVGLVVDGYFNTETDKNRNLTNIGYTTAQTNQTQLTLTDARKAFYNFSTNLYDRLRLDTVGQQLTFDLDYSKFKNTFNAAYVTSFYAPNGKSILEPLFIHNQTPSAISIKTAKVDYTLPFTKTFRVETGIKASSVKTDNNLSAQRLVAGQYKNDSTQTNHFTYQENIDAGYVNFTKEFGHTTLQWGLRTEFTSSIGNLLTASNTVSRKYFNFFPNFMLRQKFDNNTEVGLSYSRRIDRPSYQDLNPFIYYLDPYTFQAGNPFLKPQYTNLLELNYTYDAQFNLGLSYSHTSDFIVESVHTDSIKKASYATYLNLSGSDYFGINFNSPFNLRFWWSGNINVIGFYTRYTAGSNTLNGALSIGKIAYQLKLLQNFSFVGFKAELLGDYQSASIYGYFKVRPQYSVDVGLAHALWAKKANLKFSLSDVFNTRIFNVSNTIQGNYIHIIQKNETRIANLTFTYNFGNDKLKSPDPHQGAEDEKGRVKTN